MEGWKNAEMPPDVGPAPILVASDFKATIPTAKLAIEVDQETKGKGKGKDISELKNPLLL